MIASKLEDYDQLCIDTDSDNKEFCRTAEIDVSDVRYRPQTRR
jgi:hypothetical protein